MKKMPKFKNAICRGCLALGNACGHCERCDWERKQSQPPAPKKKVPTRHIFVTDDDGHWYAIPADKLGAFNAWLEAGPYWEDFKGEEFDDARLNMRISNYSFENLREVKYC